VPPTTSDASGGGSDQAENQGGMTVQQCLAAHPEIKAQVDALAESNPTLAASLDSMMGLPASAVPPNPFISPPPDCLQ
jgi:hypothetical protein